MKKKLVVFVILFVMVLLSFGTVFFSTQSRKKPVLDVLPRQVVPITQIPDAQRSAYLDAYLHAPHFPYSIPDCRFVSAISCYPQIRWQQVNGVMGLSIASHSGELDARTVSAVLFGDLEWFHTMLKSGTTAPTAPSTPLFRKFIDVGYRNGFNPLILKYLYVAHLEENPIADDDQLLALMIKKLQLYRALFQLPNLPSGDIDTPTSSSTEREMAMRVMALPISPYAKAILFYFSMQYQELHSDVFNALFDRLNLQLGFYRVGEELAQPNYFFQDISRADAAKLVSGIGFGFCHHQSQYLCQSHGEKVLSCVYSDQVTINCNSSIGSFDK